MGAIVRILASRSLRGFIVLPLFWVLAACAADVKSPAPHDVVSLSCRVGAEPMARLELLFGTSRAEGPPVSASEWAAFLDAEVTPRFPDGLTVLGGAGQWRGRGGNVVKERAIVLVIWYEAGDSREAAIEAIRSAYKRRFAQDSVMRVDGMSCVSF